MKELPNAIEHEKKLLSAMMCNGGAKIPTIAEKLTAEDFYRVEHKAIYRAILAAHAKSTTPIAPLLVQDELPEKYHSCFLALTAAEFTDARAESYMKIIKEKSRLRELLRLGEAVMNKAQADDATSEEITADLENYLMKTSVIQPATFEQIGFKAAEVYERASALSKTSGLTGVTTGLTELDRITNGLQKSDLIFLAARPAMGKTALALNIALNAATKGNTVALFSLEMSSLQLASRLLSTMSGLNATKINTGDMDGDDFRALIDAVEKTGELPLYIDDTSGMTMPTLKRKAHQFARKHKLQLIIIDYVQLMTGKGENRVQDMSDISRKLKALAKELNVPILALSQLSRNVEMRADKRPQLSDLRESGSLEQDADIVMFIYRDDYYDRENEDKTAELIIAKHRNGATGSIKLSFFRETMRFKDLTRTEY